MVQMGSVDDGDKIAGDSNATQEAIIISVLMHDATVHVSASTERRRQEGEARQEAGHHQTLRH